MRNGLGLALVQARIGRAWCLPVLFLLATTTVVKAGDFTYTTNADNTLTITGYTGPGGAVVIPSAIDGKPVTSIEQSAFWDYTGLTSVTIPYGVTNIGQSAFEACTDLTSVTIPSSVSNIGIEAFRDCISLTSIAVDTGNSAYSSVAGVLFDKSQTTLIQYPGGKAGNYAIPDSVTNIEDYAFESCRYSLTSVTIPNGVTSIGNWVFAFCYSLTNVTIGNGVTGIGNFAFTYCSSLTSVTIPYGVTNIGNFAFTYCSSLTSVTIGNSVTSIGNSAFEGCYGLTSMTIPSSVISIGNAAFNYCTGLTSVTIGNGVASIRGSAFFCCGRLIGVYFEGNAPSLCSDVFKYDDNATIYYVPGTTGWGPTFGGCPTAPWIPLITANGILGDVHVNLDDPVTIAVQTTNVEPYLGVPVDWWILALANSSCYYLNISGQWTLFDGNIAHCHPAFQGALFNLPITEVLKVTGSQAGSYTFWFVIDYPMDGVLNLTGQILLNSVTVTVQ